MLPTFFVDMPYTFSKWIKGVCTMGRKDKKTWVVERGDTLSDIAKKVYNNARLDTVLAQESGVENPDHIKPGQKIILPQKLKGARRDDDPDKDSPDEPDDGLKKEKERPLPAKAGGGSGKPPLEASAKTAKDFSVDELALYLYYGRIRYRDTKKLSIEHFAVRTLKFESRQEFTKFMQKAEQRVFDDKRYSLYSPKEGIWPNKGTVPKYKGKEISEERMRKLHEKK
jgi:hypothetical protein